MAALTEAQTRELERIRSWACCMEPERRFIAEVERERLSNALAVAQVFAIELKTELETLKKATDALSAEDAKEAKHMAYDINNIPLGNTLNAYADILEGKDN